MGHSRFELNHLIKDRAVSFNQHTSATGINITTISVLAAVEDPGYFESDVAKHNPFRDEVGGIPYKLDANGCVRPSEIPGLGVEIDEAFINAHPLIEGPCYV